jgi:hypothetical protein
VQSSAKSEPTVVDSNTNSKKMNRQLVHQHLMNTRSDQEIKQYKEVGGYAVPDIGVFHFTCQNTKELYLRVTDFANQSGFSLSLQVYNYLNRKIQLRFFCTYMAPGFESGAHLRGACSFQLRYQQNDNTRLWSLMDFDEMHIHPCNQYLK